MSGGYAVSQLLISSSDMLQTYALPNEYHAASTETGNIAEQPFKDDCTSIQSPDAFAQQQTSTIALWRLE